MEAAKGLLERVLRILIIVAILAGTTSSILLMSVHIKMLPINFVYYPQELILFLCISIAYLIADKFNIKYFKYIAAAGAMLGMINLIGFKIIIRLLLKG